MKRNSNDTSEYRKLLADAKQPRMDDELALELPVEHRAFWKNSVCRLGRMPTVTGERYNVGSKAEYPVSAWIP